MKKRYKGLLILGAIVFGIPFILWLSWLVTSPKNLSIFIMDKTSYTNEIINNRAINWVLKHYRFVKPNGKDFDPLLDYYGFFPSQGGNFQIRDLSDLNSIDLQQLALQHDVAYYADSYGVYSNMWPDDNSDSAPVTKIYGGLDSKDLDFIRAMLLLKKLVIAEFIFLAPPTQPQLRLQAEDLLGIKWTGWTGRFFSSFDLDNPDKILPGWIPALYENQYKRPWNFKDAGIVLVSEDEKLLILERGKHLENRAFPVLKTSKEDRKHFGVSDNICYPGWFDITIPNSATTKMISWYDLDLTPEGEQLLTENEIPVRFPAVIRDEGDNNFYYLAGDFGQSSVRRRFVKLKGARYAELFFTDLNDPTDKSGFFLAFYLPMMRKILADQHKAVTQK